jgi:hypothetical protein
VKKMLLLNSPAPNPILILRDIFSAMEGSFPTILDHECYEWDEFHEFIYEHSQNSSYSSYS